MVLCRRSPFFFMNIAVIFASIFYKDLNDRLWSHIKLSVISSEIFLAKKIFLLFWVFFISHCKNKFLLLYFNMILLDAICKIVSW